MYCEMFHLFEERIGRIAGESVAEGDAAFLPTTEVVGFLPQLS